MKIIKPSYLLGVGVLFLTIHATGELQMSGAQPVAAGLQDQPDAAAILSTSCTSCHDLTYVDNNLSEFEEADWRNAIQRMMGYGVVLSQAEVEALVAHLTARSAESQGAGDAAAEPADAAAAQALLNTKCTTCHDLTGVTAGRGQYTEEEWTAVLDRMKGYGATLTEAETATLLAYLTTPPEGQPE